MKFVYLAKFRCPSFADDLTVCFFSIFQKGRVKGYIYVAPFVQGPADMVVTDASAPSEI